MSDSKDEIMEATYRAICKHGYADFSIQNIAEEFDKGKSLIYYHFDDKQDLMISFMDYMKNEINSRQENVEGENPAEKLDSMLDMYLGIESDDMWEFQKAFQEFRAQAQHKSDLREKFQEIEEILIKDITDIMRDGGACDPEMRAEMFLSLLEGSLTRKVSTGDREGLKQLKHNIQKVNSSFLG